MATLRQILSMLQTRSTRAVGKTTRLTTSAESPTERSELLLILRIEGAEVEMIGRGEDVPLDCWGSGRLAAEDARQLSLEALRAR